MGDCKGCKYWREMPFPDYATQEDRDKGYKGCWRLTEGALMVSEYDANRTESYLNWPGTTLTLPDFGCVLFEAK